MTTIESVLITGANSGLGKECARQMALLDTTKKVYLGCRNEGRAQEAKRELEEATGRSIFEVVLMDVSDQDSVANAVTTLTEPIDALVMNAGGMGGPAPGTVTSDGVVQLFAVNVLGHAVLLEQLLKAKLLTKVAVYAGSEAARGVTMMGMKQPSLPSSSVDDFVAIADGSMWGSTLDPMVAYGPVKYMAAMWMSAMARKYPDVRILTMSPGGSGGTNVMQDLGGIMKFMFGIGMKVMPLFGMMHSVETGAGRYVKALTDDGFETGHFYATKGGGVSGAVADQVGHFADLGNPAFQDNALAAVERFIR
jgi:NAD(P)-dependent dehydrogenase (short-subunit alcohol dehydrogenase family)